MLAFCFALLPMRNPLRRYYGRNDPHSTTFSCYRRQPFLGSVREELRSEKVHAKSEKD